ncbi:DoxX family protein [Streptomyces spinoverrucosus]|uniref:DoxX family protein n=1 Tax=Streptomyces spinoverrucosus TaxID=284043 RepID=UPI0018C43E73|nr:DoxX family protein [Streptomyces spinoverrucosus]MBG0855737.1 DoxX family protein [Streptomyces spinoverrucosus]
MNDADIAGLLLRLVLGGTMIAHGWNHAFGGGRLPGTARWFESIGIRPGRLHALLATLTELGAGVLLVAGLLNALAAGAVIGTMAVALIANHLRNGFFIFRPGEGYEYVLMIIVVAAALAALGPGRLSADHLIGVGLDGWSGLATAVGIGSVGAAGLLATCWRRPAPRRQTDPDRQADDPQLQPE